MQLKKILVTALAMGAVVTSGLAFSAPANALACGIPALLVNGTGDAGNQLTWYSPEGDLLETIPLTDEQGYGDIALSQDGLTVYGVINEVAPVGDQIDVIDATTGQITSTITLTGDAAGVGYWDGATILSDGTLAIGSWVSNKAFKVDPATGASTVFGEASLNVFSTTGDFASLGDGDTLWLITNTDSVSYHLARIHPDNTVTIVGNLAGEAWGAGRVNDDIYFALADGTIKKMPIADIPSVEGSSELPWVNVVDSGSPESLWGAAGTQDSGSQVCSASPAGGSSALASTGTDAVSSLWVAAPMVIVGSAIVLLADRRRKV